MTWTWAGFGRCGPAGRVSELSLRKSDVLPHCWLREGSRERWEGLGWACKARGGYWVGSACRLAS